jgi:hypothetical protein
MLHIELLNNAWTVLFTWIGTTTAMVGAAYFVSTGGDALSLQHFFGSMRCTGISNLETDIGYWRRSDCASGEWCKTFAFRKSPNRQS